MELMTLKDTHLLIFHICFTAALNASMSFIDYLLFGSTFQFLIEEKKKDEEFTPLMFGTTKVKCLDLVLHPWCSSTFLYCLVYMLDTYCCIFYVHVITFIALLYFKYLEIKHLIVLVGKHWIYDVSFFYHKSYILFWVI